MNNAIQTRHPSEKVWKSFAPTSRNASISRSLEAYYAAMPENRDIPTGHRNRQPRRAAWSIAWSDLMMTMFILFAVLYIYQAANRDLAFGKQAQASAAPDTKVRKTAPLTVETVVESMNAPSSPMIQKSRHTLRLRHLSEIAGVQLETDKAVRIVLPGDLLFDTGQAELKPSALATLQQVAHAIRITDCRVNVVGHTDSVPIHSAKFATNWELSAIRACAVARYLIEDMALSPSRFYVSGHAYLQPLAPNNTPANRAANRRVELVLTQQVPTQ